MPGLRRSLGPGVMAIAMAAVACVPASATQSALAGEGVPPSSVDGHEGGLVLGEGAAGEGADGERADEVGPRPDSDRDETAPAPSDELSRLRFAVRVAPDVAPGLAEFARSLVQPGALWVGKLAGNGGRDVVIHVPRVARDDAPFDLVYHFHGTYSESVERKVDGMEKKRWVGWDRLEKTIAAIDELAVQPGRERNVALVYPISAGRRIEPGHVGWSNAMYDRIWMLPAATPGAGESFDELAAQVRDVLVTEFGVHPSKLDGEVLVEGHSAGGIALRNVAVSAPATKVAEYLFLDAGFQGWADGCWNAIVAHGADARVTMVITEKGIADPLAGRDPWCVYGKASVSLWPTVQGWCEGKMDKKPPGQTDKCQAIATAAEHWPEYEAWCQALESDMRDVPGVTVVRTKVVHAEQPRRFAGGLGLPPDRHAR